MAQKCTICTHKERESINRAILNGESNRGIAKRFGINHSAVQRHRTQHLSPHLAQAKEAEIITQADNLMEDLQHLRTQALDFLQKAKEAQDLRAAAPLITAACRVVETLAEVRGELDRKAEINIMVNPQFVQIQAVILRELGPYPDLRQRVVLALSEVSN